MQGHNPLLQSVTITSHPSVEGGSALRTFVKLITQFGKPIFDISRKKDKIFDRFRVINDWKIG